MLETGKTRTWIVVAALTIAVLYGSFCSTACAVAALPGAPQPFHCEKCEHARQSNSSPSQPDPSSHNCGRHVHPTDFVQAAGAPHADLHSVRAANVFAPAVMNLRAADFVAAASRTSGLGPPGRSETLLPETLSVLRI